LHIPLSAGAFLFTLNGAYLLAKNGTFIYSSEYRFVKLAIAIVIIGTLLKVMHWPFAANILSIGFLSFSILYMYHLIKNKRARWSGFLTLFFLFTLSLGNFLKYFIGPIPKKFQLLE